MAKSLDYYGSRDYIDSRELIERLDYLEGEDIEALDEDEREELSDLRAICEEGDQNFEDWQYGVSLIPETEFEDYARELARDIGAVSGEEQWPLQYIDWEEAADALKVDYSTITIRGTEYLGR